MHELWIAALTLLVIGGIVVIYGMLSQFQEASKQKLHFERDKITGRTMYGRWVFQEETREPH